jgi:exosortase
MSSSAQGTASPRLVAFAGALVAAGLAYLYRDVVADLVRTWTDDDRFSHGFLIPPIAAYLIWERRRSFLTADLRPSLLGLPAIGLSLLVLRVPGVGSFVSGVSLVCALAGGVLLLCGWPRVRAILFPITILLLMVPLPVLVVDRIEAPLQLATSTIAESLIRALDIPVVREGNLLALGNITLEVAHECSGFRSLISLLMLGLIFGYGADSRGWPRFITVLLTIPVVVGWNGVRVAVTAVATHHYGRGAAEGFFHDLAGWLAFAAAFATMFVFHHLLQRVAPDTAAVQEIARRKRERNSFAETK